MYCKEKFSDGVPGEIWVQCDMCKDWCPEECAGAHKDKFICDYKVDMILDKKICPFLCLKLLQAPSQCYLFKFLSLRPYVESLLIFRQNKLIDLNS